MPIMKEFLAILLVLGMLLSLVCCANADNDGLHIGFTDVCSTGDPEHWMVKKEDGVYYALDIAGKTLTYSGEWDWLGSFGDGLALVEKDGKYGYISATGEAVIPLEWDDAYDFGNGLAYLEKDGKYGYVTTFGKYFDSADSCDGYIAGINDGYLTVYDPNGNIIF